MINLSSLKTWVVFTGTLVFVTFLLYVFYTAETEASKRVVMEKQAPALGTEEAEEKCLQPLQTMVPALLNQLRAYPGIPFVEFEQKQVPVLFTPTRYARLELALFTRTVQDIVTAHLTDCFRSYQYDLQDVQIGVQSSGPLTLNVQYSIIFNRKHLKETRAPFLFSFQPQAFFASSNQYVEQQRLLPAIRTSLLQTLTVQSPFSIELYALGDTVVYKLYDAANSDFAFYFAAQYPWQQAVRGAELKEAEQISSSEKVSFKEGMFWVTN